MNKRPENTVKQICKYQYIKINIFSAEDVFYKIMNLFLNLKIPL